MKNFLFFASVNFTLFCLAGTWKLDTETKVLTDETWNIANVTLSGLTLTLGGPATKNETAASFNGILDLRSVYIGTTKIKSIKLGNGCFTTSPIKEFYCDCLYAFSQNCFSGNTTLEKVHLTHYESNTIQLKAFYNCTSLKEFILDGCTLPTVFNESCFQNCSSLEGELQSIINPKTSTFNKNAFCNCKKLKGKLILTNLGINPKAGALSATGMQELVLENCPNCTDLVNGTFQNNTALTNLTIRIPTLVNFSGTGNIFSGCTALKEITLNIPNATGINTKTSYAHAFDECRNIKKVTLEHPPIKSQDGNHLTRHLLEKHILYSVSSVASNINAPKNCIVHARRDWYKEFANAMEGFERKHAPART